VTYQGGDKDSKSELRELSEFPMELPGGRYDLTFRHASQEPEPTRAIATWVEEALPTTSQ